MGAGEGEVTCYRFSKNIFELTHLSGGFLEDKYLYPLSLSISPSCLPVSSLVHEGLERRQKARLTSGQGLKHGLVTHCPPC